MNRRKVNKKYRIAYLDQSFVFSGAEASLNSLLTCIDQDRFIPSLWFIFPMIHQERYLLPGIEKHYLATGTKWWMGSDYWSNPLRGTDFIKRLVLGFKLAFRLRENEIDILHINLARYDSFWWVFWSKFFGMKVILHCRSDPMSWIPHKIIQRGSDAIISVSNFVREKVLAKNKGARVITIYDPVYFPGTVPSVHERAEALSKLGFAQGSMIIASVGLLSPHKGHDMAIRVFKNIRSRHPDLKLFIAGGGSKEEKARLQEIAQKLDLVHDVIFSSGQLANIENVYRASSLIFSLTTRGEAFGRVPFESMAHGTPVIAPALGGAAEIIEDGHTGFLVDPLDEAEITTKALQILDDHDWARSVMERGRQRFADMLSPVRSAQEAMEVYAKVLGCNN